MCFRNADGTWAPGVSLGPGVNDPANTVHSPYVSPDGQYFFFSSNAPRDRKPAPSGPLTLQRLVDLSRSPQNGYSDIYWVRTEVIERLRSVLHHNTIDSSNSFARSSAPAWRGDNPRSRCCESVPSTSAGRSARE